MPNNFRTSVECDLTVETCIFQLVKNALKRRASSIAVRFDCDKRKIQVVDNSYGYTKSELASIFNENENSNKEEDIFAKIKCDSYAAIVTSKHELSLHTYVKLTKKSRDKLFQGYDRPSKGTTVTIYDYNSSSWTESDKSYSISYLLATLAFTEVEVSFSLRNDNENKIIFSVGKHHTPWAVFKQLKINEASEKVIQSVSQIMKRGKVDFNADSNETDKEIVNSLSVSLTTLRQGQNVSISNINVSSPLSVWSNWSYKPKQLVMHQNSDVDNTIFFSSNENIDVSNDACINLSQLSIWSDWSYQPKQLNFNNLANIRLPDVRFKVAECRISSNTINSLQIIKQVNAEFIAALANDNGRKLIILIDQHAIHERIRYEWLIETYREKGGGSYKSEKLCKDLLITDFDKNLLKLIILYKEVLTRVGIHIKRVIDTNAFIVDAVPKCFIKRKKMFNNEQHLYRLKKNVKELLIEVAKGLTHHVLPPILPITINNVIASEACHGAIKFGDPLNVKECTLLIQALQDTKAPTRCAHGRPSIIPLLDLKDVEKQNLLKNKKLNFASLKK